MHFLSLVCISALFNIKILFACFSDCVFQHYALVSVT